MRKTILACAVAACVVAPTLAFSQVVVDPPRRERPDREEGAYGSARCQELREACIHKQELGEEGEGNCRWYRENCR